MRNPLIFSLITFFYGALGGYIYPDAANPIQPYYNNMAQTTGMQFYFQAQSQSSTTTRLRITFPARSTAPVQFSPQTVSNIYPACGASFTQSYQTTIPTCVQESVDTILITLPLLNAGSASVQIQNVIIPSTPDTSSGLFGLATYTVDDILIDSNAAFGAIFIAPSFFLNALPTGTNPTNSMQNDGSTLAGYTTNYIVQFQVNIAIPVGSWFRLLLPPGFGFGSSVSAFITLNSQSKALACTTGTDPTGRPLLSMTNLTSALAAGSVYRISVRNIVNAQAQGLSQTTISFESMKQGTNTAYEQWQFQKLTMSAGTINNPVITGAPLNMALQITYTISFYPSNTVPAGGKMTVTFPPEFTSIDNTCIITNGLTEASAGSLSCVGNISPKTFTLSGFSEVVPQFIQFTGKAYNPPTSGPTSQFQISTYGATGGLIDQNTQAGVVVISSVDNPYLTIVDLYVTLTNSSLFQVSPLDFRVYPTFTTLVPATANPAVTPWGLVWLQVPMWWDPVAPSQIYRCRWGPEPASKCQEFNQVLKVWTPAAHGLGSCELPISVDHIRLTPIPGRWDFRVHTFNSDPRGGVFAAPLEQDLYTMDIPATQFTTWSYYTTSLDSGDSDTILGVSFNVGLYIPFEGCINMNFTVIQDIPNDIAAWDPTLGFNFGVNPFIPISCRVSIAGVIAGYTGSTYPTVTCFAFKGSTTPGAISNAIIQVTGFGTVIASGTAIQVDIPNILIPTSLTMKAQFTLTTSYTTYLTNPYTLNYAVVTLGNINTNPMSFVNTPGPITPVPTFVPTTICQLATYTFQFTPLQTIRAGDHVLFKFPANKFTFLRTGITSPDGTVRVIYYALLDQIYFLIRIGTGITKTAGTPQTFTMVGIRNSNGEVTRPTADFNGIIVYVIYWVTYAKIQTFPYGVTAAYTDGGVYNIVFNVLPDATGVTPGPRTASMNLDDWIYQTISFQVCHTVLPAEGLQITLPAPISPALPTATQYKSVGTTCDIMGGLVGQTTTLGFTTIMACSLVGNTYRIVGFQQIPQFQSIQIGFWLNTQTTPVTPSVIDIASYYDVPGWTTINDFLIGGITPPAITGPKYAPTKAKIISWLNWPQICRQQTSCNFNLLIKTNFDVPLFNSVTRPYGSYFIRFTLPGSAGVTAGGPKYGTKRLECRINALLSFRCQGYYLGGNYIIDMENSWVQKITLNTATTITLETRGGGNNNNRVEGIEFTTPGLFALTIAIMNGASVVETSQLEFEVFARDFLKFWINNICKGNSLHTMVQVKAQPQLGDVIPASNSANPIQIVVEFDRASSPTTTGWAFDLGTGIAHRGAIPCIAIGLTALPLTKITCTLYHGVFNNPTKVIMTGFAAWTQIGTNTIEVHVPKIYNPNNGISVENPTVGFRIQQKNAATGAILDLYYGHYDLLNVTYNQNPSPTAVDFAIAPTLPAPTLSVNTLQTPAFLSISIRCTAPMWIDDWVILQLPKVWQPISTTTFSCSFGGGAIATTCVNYPTANQISIRLRASIAANTAVAGTINLDTPPAVVPLSQKITAYYYVKNKLINTATYPSLATVLIPYPIPTWTLTADNLVNSQLATYTLSMVINYDIPYGGAIQVKIPTVYGLFNPTCTNDAVGGSTLQDAGLICTVDLVTGEMRVTGFPAFVSPALVVFQVQVNNPSAPTVSPPNWQAATFYTNAPTLQETICQNTAIIPPSLTPTTPPSPATWDTQYLWRTRCHVSQKCPLEFTVNLKTALSGTDTIEMQIDPLFTLAAEGQVFCYWNDDFAQYSFPHCTWTAGGTPTLKISAPNGATIPSAANIKLTITTLNADQGLNGIVMPPTPGNYSFSVSRMTGGVTLEEISLISVEIFATRFTAFKSTSFVVNYNLLTAIAVQFTPSIAIPTGTGKLVVTLPTKTVDGVTVFAKDLGSGVADGGFLPCHEQTGALGTWLCTLAYGDPGTGKPVTITVTGWASTLNAGTSYRFILAQVYNPTSADNKHVYVKLQSYSGSTPLNTDFMYDYSIQKWLSTSLTGPGTPTTSTPVAGSTGISFALTMTTNNPLGFIENNIYDYFIVEFPYLVSVPLSVLCGDGGGIYWSCEAIPGNRWVVLYNFGGNLASGATRSLQISQANQALGIMNFQFIVYAVKFRAVSHIYTYAPLAMPTTFINPFISPLVKTKDVALPTIPRSTKLHFTITFSMMTGSGAITIPSNGVLELVPSTNLVPTGIDSFCEVNYGLTGDVQCVCTTTLCTLTNFGAIVPGTAISLSLWGTTGTTTANTNWAINAYYTPSKSIKSFSSTAISGDAISAYSGFKQLYVPDTIPQTVTTTRAGSKGRFEFRFTPGSTWIASSFITITFPLAAGVSIPTGGVLFCGFHLIEASLCKAVSTSPLTIEMYAPHTPALTAATTYKAWVTTQCDTDTSSTNGLIFANSGDYLVTVALGAAISRVPFRVLVTSDFTNLILMPFWSNANVMNHLGVTLTPTTTITQGGKIIVTFPLTNFDNSVSLFSPTLGYSVTSSGSTIPCFSATTSTFIPVTTADEIVCRLYYGSRDHSYVEVTGFQTVTAGTSIRFLIKGFTNPSAVDNSHIDMEVRSEYPSGTILDQRFVPDVFTPQTATAALQTATYASRANDNVQATGITYNFATITVGTPTITPQSKIIFEFPPIYNIPDTSVSTGGVTPGGSVTVYGNFIVFQPTVTITAAYSVQLLGISNPYSLDITSDNPISIYTVAYRSYFQKANYNSPAVFVPGGLTISGVTTTQTVVGVMNEITLTIAPGTTGLPAGGRIEIQFPNAQAIARVEVLSSIKTSVSVSSATTFAYIDLTRTYSPSDGNIIARVTIQNPSTAAAQSIVAKFQYSSASPLLIAQGTLASAYTTLAGTLGAVNAVSLTSLTVNTATTLSFVYTAAALTVSSVVITYTGFQDPASVDCSINGVTATCTQTSAGVITITGVTFTVTTNTITLNLKNAASVTGQSFMVQSYTSTSVLLDTAVSLQIRTVANAFTTFSFNFGTNSIGVTNFITASFRPSVAVTNPIFYFEFGPEYAANIGTGLTNGARFPCESTTLTGLVCTITLGLAGKYGPRVTVTGVASIGTGTTYDIGIFRFLNPTTIYSSVAVAFRIATISIGNNENYLFGRYVVSSQLVAAGTVSLTGTYAVSSTQVQATNTITLTIAGQSASSDTQVLITLPGTFFNLNTYTAISCGSDTCFYYPYAGAIVWQSGGTQSGSIVVTITGLTNPIHLQAPASTMKAYLYNPLASTGNYIGLWTLSPSSAYTSGTISGLTLTLLETSNTANPVLYSLTFTTSKFVPSGGKIQLELPSSTFTTPTSIRISDVVVISGGPTGSLFGSASCSSTPCYITFSGFTSFSAGSTTIQFSMTQVKQAGTGALYTYLDSTNTYIIESLASVALPYSITATYSSKSGSLYLPLWSSTVMNGFGDILFAVQTVTASVVKGTHNFYITVPTSTFPITYTGKLRCKFTSQTGTSSSTSYLSDYCYVDTTNNLVIGPPTGISLIGTTEWLLRIYAVESNVRGIQYPNTNSAQKFQFDLKNTALTNIHETNVVYYRIFKGLVTNSGCTMSYVANTGARNLIDVRFTTTNAIPAYSSGGAIILEIPPWKAGIQVHAIDLNTGALDLSAVYCVAKIGVSSAAAPNTFRCFIQKGDLFGNRPARILVQNFLAIGANTFVEITVSINNYNLVGLWSSASILTMGSSTTYLDVYHNPYLTYTANPAVLSTTAGTFPTLSSYLVQSNTGFTLNVAPSTVTPFTVYDRFRFSFNSRMINPTTMAVATHTLDRWSDSETFITPPSGWATTTTPIGLVISNLLCPISTVTFTSTFKVDIIQRKVLTYIVTFLTPNPTFTPGTITPASVSGSSLNLGSRSLNTFSFTPQQAIPAGGAIKITFPTGFTVESACTNTLGITSYTTCSATGQVITMTNINAIAVNTALQIIAYAKNPATAGLTGTFSIQTYEDAAATMLISQNLAVPGITITSIAALNWLYLAEPLVAKKRAQAYDNAPLQFTIAPTAAVAPFATLSITYAVAAYFTTTYQDIVGFITDLTTGTVMAAQRIDVTATPWRVYAPLETTLAAGGNYRLYLWLNRNNPTYGFGYPASNTANCIVGGQTKLLVVPLQGFTNPWIVSRITTNARYSTFYFQLTIPVGVPVNNNRLTQYIANNVNYGQIIFQFYTKDAAGNTLMPVNLGKSINNGDALDCYSVTTGISFNCKIGLGAAAFSVPASVIMVPKVNIPEGTTVRIHFPRILLPPSSSYLTYVQAYSRMYNAGTNTWTNRNFMLFDPFFYTTASTIPAPLSLAAPTWTNNIVGAFGVATFTFTMASLGGNNLLDPSSYDRIVLETPTSGMALQNDQTFPLGCNRGTTRVYQLSQWVELDITPTSLTGGLSTSVQYSNFKNAPYVIATGVSWTLYIWKDANLKQIINYNPVTPPAPNVFTSQSISWIVTPLTSGIQDYWVSFRGTNPVPAGGSFAISIPNTFQSVASQCLILAGLSNADCSVQSTVAVKSILLSLANPYDPAVDGTINVKFTATNPSVAGTTAQFTVSSNWPTLELIDQSLALGTVPVTAVLNLIQFDLTSLLQWQIKTCGGDQGPIYMELNLKNAHSFVSFSTGAYLSIRLGVPGFAMPYALTTEWEELLCWYDFPYATTPIKYVKTHDCRWNGGDIRIAVPEEQSIVIGQTFFLTIYTRGSVTLYNDGIVAPTPPGRYWLHFFTSNPLEEAFLWETIPACPLNNFAGEAYVHDSGQLTSVEFWFTPTTTVPRSSLGGRILVEIQTHNELWPFYAVDVGFGIGPNAAALFGCGGRMTSGATFLSPDLGTNTVTSCQLYAPATQGSATPAFVYSIDMQQLTAGTAYNFQISKLLNPVAPNNDVRFFTHFRIRLQRLVSGDYVDTNNHTIWHAISYLKTYGATTTTCTTPTLTDTRVNILTDYFTYYFNTFGYTFLLANANRMIYEFNHVDFLLPNSVTCRWWQTNAINSLVRCVPMRHSYWLTTDFAYDMVNTGYWEFRLENSITNPYYRIVGGIPLKYWIVINNRINRYATCAYQNSNNNIEVVMQTPSDKNDINVQLTYQIGLYLQTIHPKLSYFKMTMPGDAAPTGDFLPLSQSCLVRRGLVPVNVLDPNNPIICTIHSSTWPPPQTLYEIRIYNFGPFSQSYTPYFIIFDMKLQNPPTAKWTGTWSVTTFDNYEVDLTRTMDTNAASDGRTWIGVKQFPVMVRVYRNTIGFEDRRCAVSQWCEINIRVKTKSDIPLYLGSSGGRAEVWMPTDFDIPNAGTPICTNGNGDDTPIYRHSELDGQYCQITADRKVIFNLDNTTGIRQDTCQMLYLNTINSIGGNNGFQAAAAPGLNNFEVYFYQDSQLMEFANSNGLTQPVNPLTVTWSENPFREDNHNSVYRVRFDVSVTIPPGYTINTNLDVTKQRITYLAIELNSQQTICCSPGFAANLGYYADGTTVPCKAVSGLVPTASGLKCVIQRPVLLSHPDFPVTVVISGFEEIIEGTTNIEIHLIKITTPPNNNYGLMKIGAFTIYGPASASPTKVWIIDPVSFYLPSVGNQGGFPYQISPVYPVINPNTVGSLINVNLQFDQTFNMNAGDDYWLKFPAAKTAPYAAYNDPLFNIPDDGSIYAVAGGVQLQVVVYNDAFVNWIFFRIPTGSPTITASTTRILQISQLRNMAWADPNNWDLELWCIRNKIRIQMTKWSGLAPAVVSNFNSLVFTTSSPFANDVYVSNYFKFVPSYEIPAGSSFTINFPSPDFNILPSSAPAAICDIISSTMLTGCAIGASTVTFTALTDISLGTPLEINLNGCKNPANAFIYASGAINMEVRHPAPATAPIFYPLINAGPFNSITYKAPLDPSQIYILVIPSSKYVGVTASYTFAVQTSRFLPTGGILYLQFPPNWRYTQPGNVAKTVTVDSIYGGWTNSKLTYTSSYSSITGVYQLVSGFDWPGKQTLYIKINSFTNPNVADFVTPSTYDSGLFQSYTVYDSVTLDQTDPLDSSTNIEYETYTSIFNTPTTSLSPTTGGEIATYDLSMSTTASIPPNSTFEMEFPTGFSSTLTTYDKSLTCILTIGTNDPQTVSCSAVNGKLAIPLTDGITAGDTFSLSVSGVSNPNQGTGGAISFKVTDPNDQVIGFTPTGMIVAPTSPPTFWDLSSLSSTSTSLQTKSDYTICVSTDKALDSTDEIIIEFPPQFTIRGSSYPCTAGAGTLNGFTYASEGPNCTLNKNERRFTITGQTNSLAAGPPTHVLCYVIENIENPGDSGQSGNFIVSLYKPSLNEVSLKTSGLLSYPSTIAYSRQGYRVIIDEINDFPLGLMSESVRATLEIKVPYTVQLIPSCPGFTFQPSIITFYSYLSATQTFRILPNPSTPIGSYMITWSKFEDDPTTQFSEVPDSAFNYVSSPQYQQLTLTVGVSVSRTALGATSLPITITLSQSPAANLTVYFNTSKPSQPDQIIFHPDPLVFQPGDLQKTFTYTSNSQAVSGQVLFSIDSTYASKYYMPVKLLNFEILDVDIASPQILNDYIVDMDRTWLYYRVSTSESGWVYWMLTYYGTVKPPCDEIQNSTLRTVRETQTDVTEYFGFNSSFQAPVTSTFIYHDTYLKITGLEEQTDYVLYYCVYDLAGNLNGTRTRHFTTLDKHQPTAFSVSLTNDTNTTKLISTFSLITGIIQSRFSVVSAPPKFSIAGNTDTKIANIINDTTVVYQFILYQNKTADENSPRSYIETLENSKYILVELIPTVVESFDIVSNSYEIVKTAQEFVTTPKLLAIGEEYVEFEVGLKRNGTLYAIVQLANFTKPSARQIQHCLDSTNFQLGAGECISVTVVYPQKSTFGVYKTFKVSFTGLFDYTEYKVFFIGDNTLPVNPDLMTRDEVYEIEFTTMMEVFSVVEWYQSASVLQSSFMVLSLILSMLLFI